MYRFSPELEVFLVHPGGPFFKNRDDGCWSVPKGLAGDGENLLAAARREFTEETGLESKEPFIDLEKIKQKGGKTVFAWAFQGTVPDHFQPESNMFQVEWPPHSGQINSYPEIDRALFFPVDVAIRKINQAQSLFIKRLQEFLKN